jgi:hypothetical protein
MSGVKCMNTTVASCVNMIYLELKYSVQVWDRSLLSVTIGLDVAYRRHPGVQFLTYMKILKKCQIFEYAVSSAHIG